VNDFTFLNPTRIILGRNAEEQTGQWIKQYGGTTVLVHHDSQYVKQSGLVDKIIANIISAGLKVVELGGVVPNPHISLIYKGIELCKKEKVDFCLAIGGGSVIDSTKAIALGIVYDGDVWDFYTVDAAGQAIAIPQKTAPVGVVLTIAATGSEASNSSVITNVEKGLKRYCNNDICRPVFAIENPELTTSLPPFQTACGIIDILSHSMERYFTPPDGGNELTDRLCEAVFHTCFTAARVLKDDPNDYNARASLMAASSLSHNNLTGMGRFQDWATHAIEHELSGEFNVTHGAGLAAIFPAWMKYVCKDSPDIFVKWATRMMGVDYDYEKPERTILEGIDRTERFYSSLGMPTRLRDMPGVGLIGEDVMLKMAKRVQVKNADGTIGRVKYLATRDIVEIFKLAL
jgi:alcohol dehydrogenase YqhD (iron-dependent ADH family)